MRTHTGTIRQAVKMRILSSLSWWWRFPLDWGEGKAGDDVRLFLLAFFNALRDKSKLLERINLLRCENGREIDAF